MLASFILFFLLPLIIITILYILILRGVRRSVKFTQNLQPMTRIPATSREHSFKIQVTRTQLKRGRSAILRGGHDKKTARQQQELCQIQQVQRQARMRMNRSLIRILGREYLFSVSLSLYYLYFALLFLVCIIIAFFTCFAPFHAERLLVVLVPADLWDNNRILWKIHDVLYHISGICLFANSVCNPILYNIVFRRIRAEFKSALTCCGKQRRDSTRTHRISTISQTPKTAEF